VAVREVALDAVLDDLGRLGPQNRERIAVLTAPRLPRQNRSV